MYEQGPQEVTVSAYLESAVAHLLTGERSLEAGEYTLHTTKGTHIWVRSNATRITDITLDFPPVSGESITIRSIYNLRNTALGPDDPSSFEVIEANQRFGAPYDQDGSLHTVHCSLTPRLMDDIRGLLKEAKITGEPRDLLHQARSERWRKIGNGAIKVLSFLGDGMMGRRARYV